MADEQDNDTPEPGDAPEQAPEASAPEAGVPDSEATDAGAADSGAAQADAAGDAAQEADADEAADGDASGGDTAAPAAPAQQQPAAEQLAPKERRRRARSRHSGEARPSRTPEERHAERVAERRTKAVRRRARRLQERAKSAERRAAAPPPEPLPPVHAPVEGKRRVRQGVVVSDKAQKTITVRIDVARPHRRYEKIVRSSSTVHAHDENNDAHEGDVVRVIESRPLSRTKRWALVDVLERAR